ncbi:MAG TPA: hypothetical protein VFK05_21895 [Polyangiaceae bacterium]|nr:hypothetical protein [Polyangiaceae bacterium]
MTTDPGLGPVQREHASTLRSMTAAEPIPDDEIAGAAVYCEPKPLHAVSEHKTLELETVKLAKDIDPRKLPTELKLRRPVLHVLPASDPNWPAPAPQLDSSFPSHYDSGWPPPETVLTSSQPPLSARRRSFVPLVLLVLFGATVLLLVGARTRHRASVAAIASRPATLAAAAAPNVVQAPQSAPVATPNAVTPPASASASSADSSESQQESAAVSQEESAAALASAQPADPAPSAAPARLSDAPHHALKPASPPNANGPALNAPTTAKQKRAIY